MSQTRRSSLTPINQDHNILFFSIIFFFSLRLLNLLQYSHITYNNIILYYNEHLTNPHKSILKKKIPIGTPL